MLEVVKEHDGLAGASVPILYVLRVEVKRR